MQPKGDTCAQGTKEYVASSSSSLSSSLAGGEICLPVGQSLQLGRAPRAVQTAVGIGIRQQLQPMSRV